MDIRTDIKKINLDATKELTVKVVSNIDDLINEAREEDEIPFWAELWPSAIAMARYIWAEKDFNNCRVLELGAGIGLAGLAAALKGGNVLQTDFISQALLLTAENCRLNGAKTSYRLADWREFHLDDKFDVILGSDILYEPKMHTYIKDIIHNNLEDQGQVYLADPGRSFAGDFLQPFKDTWSICSETIEVEERAKFYPIQIYNLQKMGG